MADPRKMLVSRVDIRDIVDEVRKGRTPKADGMRVLSQNTVKSGNERKVIRNQERNDSARQDILKTKPTLREEVARGLGSGSRSVLRGTGQILDIVGAPLNAAVNLLPGEQGLSLSPAQDAADALSDALGLGRPQGDLEEVVGKGIEGATGGLVTAGAALPFAGANTVGGAVAKSLSASPVVDAISGASGMMSQDVADKLGANPVVSALAGLAGGVGGAVGAGRIGRTRVPVNDIAVEDDLARVLDNRPAPEAVDYQKPVVPESVHPDDASVVPSKGGLESGRGMDEREQARYDKRIWQDKSNQEEVPEAEIPAAIRQTEEPLRTEPEARGGQGVSFKHLNSTDDVKKLLDEVKEGLPQSKSLSQDDIRQQASELNLTEEDFLKSRGLQGLEAYSVKARDILKTVGEDTVKILDELGDLEDPKALLAIARLGAVSEHVKGSVSGPAGRILNSFKIDAERVKAAQTLTGALATPRGRRRVAKLLQEYRGDPDALGKIARDAVDPSLRDKVFSFRYNMMLSGPKTHVYNILGNTANIAVDLAEHGVAATMGIGRKMSGDLDRVTGREVAARVTGAVVGARRGLATMRQAYKEGRPLDDTTRTEMKAGRVSKFEVPVKALAAEDEFFRSVAGMSNTYGAAVRKAVKEGLTGDGLKARIQNLIDNPTKDILEDSAEYSKKMRFQDDPSFLGKMIETARVHHKDDTILTSLGRDGLSLVLPFVRTPDSLLRTALRRSPVGVFEGQNIKDFRAGGARRDLAIGRVAMGSGVTAYVGSKALEGLITGEGPRDYKKRQAMELTGWQPNSIKIGGKYYSYAGLEPLSMVLSGTATTLERWDSTPNKDYFTKAGKQVFNAAELLANQSWAEGLSDLFGIFEAPEGQSEASIHNFLANMAQSFVVPAAVRQVNQSFFDNKTRDTRGDDSLGDRVVNRIKTGIPTVSDDLPAQVDALGREIGHGDALGPDFLSRASAPLAEGTPTASEISRLMGSDPEGKVLLDRVSRSVNTKEFPIGRLTSLEHHNYQVATGAYLDSLMSEAMASPEWKTLSDDDKRAEVKSMAEDARKWAREDTFSGTEEENKPPKAASLSPIPSAEAATPAPSDGDDFPFGEITSMRRTVKGNAAVGGKTNSKHLDGDALDFVPSEGVSWGQLVEEAQNFFGPEARVIHEYPGTRKEHVHVQLPGLNAPYYGKNGTK